MVANVDLDAILTYWDAHIAAGPFPFLLTVTGQTTPAEQTLFQSKPPPLLLSFAVVTIDNNETISYLTFNKHALYVFVHLLWVLMLFTVDFQCT